MAFVRKKTIKGREYHYLVESYRDNGKVKQKTLAYLGRHPSVQAKVEWLGRRVNLYRGHIEENRALIHTRKYARESIERYTRIVSKAEQELEALKAVVPKLVSRGAVN